MRKITQNASNAFYRGQAYSNSNTRVEIRDGETFLYLHNNMIAHKTKDALYITHCGWSSNTTKERLNGVLDAFDLPKISQSNWVWYIGNEEFQGNKLFQI